MLTGALPWIFTALSVSFTALGHLLYRRYAISKQMSFLALTGAAFILIPVFSYLALRDLTIAQVYLCAAAAPVLTTLGAWAFLKEKINRHHIIGLVLITVGTVMYLWFSP
jgi:uncharacterized membrane protein